MSHITWFEPASLEEAIALLVQHGPRAWAIAGGTEIVAKLNTGQISAECLVDLSGLKVLTGIAESGAGVRIGPLTTFRELVASPLIQARYPVLAQAAGKIGGGQVQNLGTLGGNICNAEPCADAATACIALHATLVICGPQGERRLPIEAFFQSPGSTVLDRGEILSDILLPEWPAPAGGAYEKLSLRRAMDQSIIAVAASLAVDAAGRCVQAGIGLATAAPRPMRALEAETQLIGRPLSPQAIRRAALAASQEAQPRDSRKASAAYRREALRSLAEQALSRAAPNEAPPGDEAESA